MAFRQTLMNEIKELGATTLFFGVWIGALLLIKTLILAEYHVAFSEWSMALVGAIVLAKVVLVLEHVPLGRWFQSRPAWLDVAVRTALYVLGVFVVLVLERAFEGRHEYGGFGPSLAKMFQMAEGPHVWVNTICLAGALLAYNVMSVIQLQLGEKGLRQLFMSPLPEQTAE